MKRFLFCLTIPTLFIVSLSVNSPDSSIHTSKRTLDAVTAGGPGNLPAGSCGSLVYFRKGAVVTTVTSDSAGKEMSRQIATVLNVTDKAGILIGLVKTDNSTSMGKSTRNLEYKCDGKALFMDLNSVMANFAALKGAKASATTLDFPIQLSVGQKLPDASVTIEIDRGKMKMKMSATHVDRKVEKIERVTTPAGGYNCYRVSSTVKTTMDMGNAAMNEQMAGKMAGGAAPSKMIAWFSPDLGIVKMETYSGNKMVTRSQIISVKQ